MKTGYAGGVRMVKATYKERDGGAELLCVGHAENDADGEIVCAAVSALCGTLAAVLLREKEAFGARVSEKKRGIVASRGKRRALPYFRFAATGLKKLAEAYPRHIELAEDSYKL